MALASAIVLHGATLALLLRLPARRLPPSQPMRTVRLVLLRPPTAPGVAVRAATQPAPPVPNPPLVPILPDVEIGAPPAVSTPWLPTVAEPSRTRAVREAPRRRPPPSHPRRAAQQAVVRSAPPDLHEGSPSSPHDVAAGASASSTSDISAGASAASPDPTWEGRLAAWIVAHKRYPAISRDDDQEGTVAVRFTVTRNGRVRDVRVVHGSGFPALDEAAIDLLRDASVPPFPDDMPQAAVTVSVNLEYALR